MTRWYWKNLHWKLSTYHWAVIIECLDDDLTLDETLSVIHNNPEIDLDIRYNQDVTVSVCLIYNFTPKLAYRILKRYIHAKLWWDKPKGNFEVHQKDWKYDQIQQNIIPVYQLKLDSDKFSYAIEFVNIHENTCTWSCFVTKGLICSHIFYWALYHQKKLNLNEIKQLLTQSPIMNRLHKTEGFFKKAKLFADHISLKGRSGGRHYELQFANKLKKLHSSIELDLFCIRKIMD